ncbi:amidohydrolase [Novosphingobium album (ex Liu et al. 2023)]|uniref:Amidohydrolase n=1 Tax=Novosphingobium album (ex Liu et al. 2023) TaxID=3031130 RepID=A0ABT5WV35_9SPHN|nr:amidohydrolase [Novosphingobium album (ex Liu et al. 2023)]MDE8653769.1 amidohydrolase [Novosphingobium album (ex Liu et al. 2023)]
MKRAALMLAALAALVPAGAATAQDFAITGATVAIGDGSEPVANGTVVVRAGKIVAAGAGVAVPPGVQVLDGSGMWVTPGLFAAFSDMGLYDVQAVGESDDRSADTSPFNAALDVTPAINPAAQDIAVSREGGVTRASVTPFNGSSIFAGQGAIIDLGADANAVTVPHAFQLVDLSEGGARLAGGSRVAAYVVLHNALREARDVAAMGPASDRKADAMLTRADAAALGPVIEGRQPLYVGVERAVDIRSVLALKREFPKLDLVLVGATEGWLVAGEIAAAGVPVIATALNDLPSSFEKLAATQSNIGRMKRAGVTVAIGMLAGSNQPRYAPQQAGNLVALAKLPGAAGLTWGEALAAITSIPARISGLGGTAGIKAGVLAPGAVGDVVIWDGDPLEVSSAPRRVFIDGVEQPLDNHQSRLKQRYHDLDESVLPKAYDW